jgi:branched-chain amino acid transport system permease protein
MSDVILETLVLAAAYGIVSLSLNLQYGLTGLLNFGQGFLFAVGGYTVAVCYFHGWPGWIGVVAAPFAGALGGILLALPARRLESHYWALLTLGVAELFLAVMGDEDKIAGGALGTFGIPRIEPALLLLISGAVIAVVIAIFERMRRSQFGRLMRIQREDELLLAALGRDPFRLQLVVMAVGGAVAALGGVVLAFWLTLIAPTVFDLNQAVIVWAMMIVGGRGNNYGAIVGAVAMEAVFFGTTRLPEFWVFDSENTALLQTVIVGVALVLMLMFRPQGLLPERKVRHLGRRSAPPPVTSPVPDADLQHAVES